MSNSHFPPLVSLKHLPYQLLFQKNSLLVYLKVCWMIIAATMDFRILCFCNEKSLTH